MSKIRVDVRWFVLPFGSLKTLMILASILLIGNVADLGSTYWFLSRVDFDLSYEASQFGRILFTSFGFFWGGIASIFFSLAATISLSVLIFHLMRRTKYERLTKVMPAAILISSGIVYCFVAIHNLWLFYPPYIAFASLPIIQGIYNYSLNSIFFTPIIWIGLAIVLFLYKIGYGKEKLLAV